MSAEAVIVGCPAAGSAYCSTRGQPHTADEYRAYKSWEKTIWIVWPLGMAALALLWVMEKEN